MSDKLRGLAHLPYYEQFVKWFAGDPMVSCIGSWMGIEVLETDTNRATLRFRNEQRFSNAAGSLHGGVLSVVADTAMGTAFSCSLSENETFSSMDLHVNFLRPVAPGTELTFTAKVAYRGRRTGLCSCDVVNDAGKLVAQATSTCIVLPIDTSR